MGQELELIMALVLQLPCLFFAQHAFTLFKECQLFFEAFSSESHSG